MKKGKSKLETEEFSKKEEQAEAGQEAPAPDFGLREQEKAGARAPELEIERLKTERDEALDGLLRSRAEFENYRRRIVREKEQARLEGQGEVMEELLSVVDACEKGLESIPDSEDDSPLAPFRKGYELLLKQLRDLLKKFNIEETPGVGVKFDPNFHEAVIREETDEHEEGEILEEYRKGYLIGNRLLRPSQVKVAVRPNNHP